MESFFRRFKNALVLIAILLVQTIALATQLHRPADPLRPDGQHVRLIRLWAATVIVPFERMTSASGHGIRGAWSNYIALRHVRQQNLDLQRQITQLRLERAALSEDALEAHRLSALLNFKQHYAAATIVAQVVGTSGSEQSRLFTLDKGWHDGLRPGMPVVTPDGIVGKLRDVFPSASQLLLISDGTSGAGVMLQSSRTRAVLRGTPQGRIVITNLTSDPRIKPGEQVLTSGGDQVYPRGLPVGTIESIAADREHPPYTRITLKPAANLLQLEEVLVITGTGNAPSPQVEQELAADAGTTRATESRAADIRAERLPSLHDTPGGDPPAEPNAGADAAMPPPANSTNLTPHPKPALHPDRYSPNTVPPADSLTPGAPRH